ncbi:MAG: DUF4832 domain-containing protein [Burkholderiaceae bacterium]
MARPPTPRRLPAAVDDASAASAARRGDKRRAATDLMLRLGQFATACAMLAAACSGGTSSSQPVQAPAPSPAPSPAPGAPPGTTTATFVASSADYPNPDRGFYGSAGDDFVAGFDPASVQSVYASGRRLLIASVSLAAFRTGDLSAAFLSALGDRFAAVRSAGMKTTLLFAYDFSGSGVDASATRIARHLEQLQPVLAANADVIPYMRAGFIGAWGEWHSSQSGNSCDEGSAPTSCAAAAANRAIVRDALLRNVPPTTQIDFRYPADLQAWYPDGDAPAQVGMDDDCFLAGPSDTGTYTQPGQRAYAQLLTRQGSFGGETCENAETPIRGTCADILSEGALYHLAWLNGDYAPSVVDGWKNAGCYDQVSASMGYRIQLDRVSNAPTVARGGTLAVHVDLRNVGWARMFVARALVVTIRRRDTGETLAAGAGNLATLAPQATASTRIVVQLPIPAGAATGLYDVFASAPDAFAATQDDVRFSVRFANADQPAAGQSWDASTARLSTGTTVTVQ